MLGNLFEGAWQHATVVHGDLGDRLDVLARDGWEAWHDHLREDFKRESGQRC